MSSDGPLMDDFVVIPGYILGRQIAVNSRCRIYEGIDREDLTKTVAIQIARSKDDKTKAHYIKIKEVLRTLDHPGIPALLQDGTAEEFPYLIFAWWPVSDLATTFQGRRDQTPEQVLTILNQVAAVLDYAFRSREFRELTGPRVSHGDLHASRIGYSRDGQLGVTGFGEAAAMEPIGNLHYWAPEQLRHGQSATQYASDIYALAELAYFLSCGEYPFQHAQENLADGDARPKVTVRNVRPEFPETVDLVLARGLAKDPKDRLLDAEQFVRSLALAFGLEHVHSEWWKKSEPYRELDRLLAKVIDPRSDLTAASDAIKKISLDDFYEESKDDFFDIADWAPLLCNLDRFVELLTTPNEEVQRKLVKLASPLGELCGRAIADGLIARQYRLAEKDLRYCLSAMLRPWCSGAGHIEAILRNCEDAEVCRIAALALREGEEDDAVAAALRQGFIHPDESVRETAFCSYLIWLNDWAPYYLENHVSGLIAPLLGALAPGELCRQVFSQLTNPQMLLVREIGRQMAKPATRSAECPNDNRVTAAYVLRFFPERFDDFRDNLEMAIKDPDPGLSSTARETHAQLTAPRK